MKERAGLINLLVELARRELPDGHQITARRGTEFVDNRGTGLVALYTPGGGGGNRRQELLSTGN